MASTWYLRWFFVCIFLQTGLIYILFKEIPFHRGTALDCDEKRQNELQFYNKVVETLSQSINSTQQQNKDEIGVIQQGFRDIANSVRANMQDFMATKKNAASDIKDTYPDLMKYRYTLADADSNPGEIFKTTIALEVSLCQENGLKFWTVKTEMLGWVFDDSGFTGEWPVRELFRKILARPTGYAPNLVLDVGSNSGIFSMIAAVYNTKRIYAFDPQPLCAQYVTLASKLNGFDKRIAVINAFVGANETLVTPIPSDTCWGKFKVGGTGNNEMVDIHSVSLDRHFVNDPDEIDLMKVDVEGAELIVLQGARELFKKHRVRTLVVEITAGWWHDFGIEYEIGAALVKDILVDAGYQMWVMSNTTNPPKKLDGWPALDAEMHPPPGYHNQKNLVFSLEDLYD